MIESDFNEEIKPLKSTLLATDGMLPSSSSVCVAALLQGLAQKHLQNLD
jgi:acid phosphatase family membrane protein YuiD